MLIEYRSSRNVLNEHFLGGSIVHYILLCALIIMYQIYKKILNSRFWNGELNILYSFLYKLISLSGRGALSAAGRQLSDHSNNRESSLDDSGVVDDHDDGEHTSDDQAPHPHPRRHLLIPQLPPPPNHPPTPMPMPMQTPMQIPMPMQMPMPMPTPMPTPMMPMPMPQIQQVRSHFVSKKRKLKFSI